MHEMCVYVCVLHVWVDFVHVCMCRCMLEVSMYVYMHAADVLASSGVSIRIPLQVPCAEVPAPLIPSRSDHECKCASTYIPGPYYALILKGRLITT